MTKGIFLSAWSGYIHQTHKNVCGI